MPLFAHHVKGSALLLFVDNTHAIGCLLKRSASVRESPDRKRRIHVTPGQPWTKDDQDPPRSFDNLPSFIRTRMNQLARLIWQAVTSLDIILWIEYVNTKLNIADLPSRELPLPMPAIRLGSMCSVSNTQ